MLFFAALALPILAIIALEVVLLGFVGWLGHRDNFVGVLVGVILIAVSMHVFGAVDVVSPIAQNPLTALAMLGGYIALALPVSQKFLWRNYLIECANRDLENVDAIRAKFFDVRRHHEDEAAETAARIDAVTAGDTSFEPGSYEPFTDERDRVFQESQAEYEAAFAHFWEHEMSPKADENKARIVSYMAYWPAISLYTLVGDYLLRLFTRMFETFKRSFDRDAEKRYLKSYNQAAHQQEAS